MKIIVLLSLIGCYLAEATSHCSNGEFGRRTCSLESNPEITKIVDGRVFVGVENALQVFQSDLSGDPQIIDLGSDAETVSRCSGFGADDFGINQEECKNFIQTITVDPDDDNRVLICGTNAYVPRCNVHQISDVANYSRLSDAESDAGYSSHSNTRLITSILASNGQFFSATGFSRSGDTSLRMSLDPLGGGDTSFTVSTPDDNNWLDQPTFVSVHELGDYIYFFMTEIALEVSTFQEARYSKSNPNLQNRSWNWNEIPHFPKGKDDMLCGRERNTFLL